MSQKQSNSKKSTSVRKADTAKAGKRSGPYTHPPRSTRSRGELEARRLRRARLDGAFGRYTSVEVYNFLVTGTSKPPRAKLTKKQLEKLALVLKNNKPVDVEAA